MQSDQVPASVDFSQIGKVLGYSAEKQGLGKLQARLDPGLQFCLQGSASCDLLGSVVPCVGLMCRLARSTCLKSSQGQTQPSS